MDRQLIINMLTFGFVGGFLFYIGHSFTTWEFWVVLICMSIVQFNNSIDE